MHVDFECPVCGKKHQWSYPEIADLGYWKGCDWFWCDSCQAEMRLGLEKRNETVTLDLLHIPAANCWQWVDMAVEEVIETHQYEWEKQQYRPPGYPAQGICLASHVHQGFTEGKTRIPV